MSSHVLIPIWLLWHQVVEQGANKRLTRVKKIGEKVEFVRRSRGERELVGRERVLCMLARDIFFRGFFLEGQVG